MRKAGNFKLTITAVGFISPCKKEKTETKEANMFLRNKMCDRCVKFSGRYHEAVFQVRDDVDLIMKKLSKLLPKTCWKEEKKEGLNIYFLRKGDASRVARELDDIFTVKRSFKFVGMKKGKSLIRDFYSIRG
jgi:NMD protein affecting ribosome stability and mRNA decay